jgi:hypothetical protein
MYHHQFPRQHPAALFKERDKMIRYIQHCSFGRNLQRPNLTGVNDTVELPPIQCFR